MKILAILKLPNTCLNLIQILHRITHIVHLNTDFYDLITRSQNVTNELGYPLFLIIQGHNRFPLIVYPNSHSTPQSHSLLRLIIICRVQKRFRIVAIIETNNRSCKKSLFNEAFAISLRHIYICAREQEAKQSHSTTSSPSLSPYT